jgi:hypothetical protein
MEKPTGGFMYESTIAGAFLYTWGAHDQFRERIGQNAVISNSQNPLDHLLGDMVMRTDDRWFIAELKQDEDGFKKEVWETTTAAGSPSGIVPKPHRRDFLLDLGDPQYSFKAVHYSSRAHFAVWVKSNDFQIAEYAFKAAPGLRSPKHSPPHPNSVCIKRLSTPSFYNFIRGTTLRFSDFYDEVTLKNPTRHPLCEGIFSHGLGVPYKTIEKYIELLVKHEQNSTNAALDASIILGHVSASGSAPFQPICGSSFEGLLNEMQKKIGLVKDNKPAASSNGMKKKP